MYICVYIYMYICINVYMYIFMCNFDIAELQCAAVCCSLLQFVAVCCKV